MAIDFPSSPSVGQTYTYGSRTWQYNAQGGWQRVPVANLMNDIPDGRLTLTSGTPVMTSTVSGASTVYYTPYCGNNVPIYDGTNWTLWTFSEMSQTLTDTTKSPAATGQDSCYDMFVWNDGGTLRCTRGPVWVQSASVTCTSASPGVFTWTSHGLHDAQMFYFTGSAPTGLVAGTPYYITKVDANTFKVSSSVANQVAGTYINTSSTGSGLTGFCPNNVRGTGAATSELERVNGILMNKYAITNGPGADRGTYVGTIYTNPSNTVDFIYGALAANCTAACLYVWNMYNRVQIATGWADTTDSWTYTSATIRAANASATARCSFVWGQVEDCIDAAYHGVISVAATAGHLAIGYDTVASFFGYTADEANTNGVSVVGRYVGTPAVGWHYVSAVENSVGATTTFYGDAGGPTVLQTGSYFVARM